MVELVDELEGEPLAVLRVVARLETLLDEELLAQVGRARTENVAWWQIGEALGVTAQAVHRRFAWMV